ncbi:MAG TPA: UDP-N-acetylglucosamine 1-carboxyvinyltransferase [Lachnospiraceae bacterium]|nr:UDP-N-acetylglucosamine 1-carboxyvinyltransferase [Lachnospiraceae bacterium]
MGKILVGGDVCLKGEIPVQGSKNAALPIMAGAVLHKGCTVLHNCPRISDVYNMEKMLINLGAKIHWEGHTLIIDCSRICEIAVEEGLSGRMRSSVMLMGSMLGRCGRVQIGYPGGCVIGKRPIDYHLDLFADMGVNIDREGQQLILSCNGLRGVCHRFPRPSVGATENGILAAVHAEEPVVLENCAREPEIGYLCAFLRCMGADIDGDGTDRICIGGGSRLHDGEYTIPADRIAAGTLLLSGAITRGQVNLAGAPRRDMDELLKVYEKMGGQFSWNGGTLLTDSRHVKKSVGRIVTDVYPGFPTDLQSPLMAVCCTLEGESRIRETIFEDRFRAAGQLARMGARIVTAGDEALVKGPVRLTGRTVRAQDLRGGAALVVAGLAARGQTVVECQEYIERGYESFYEEINLLGGRIVKMDSEA